jgi:hypothetical protein
MSSQATAPNTEAAILARLIQAHERELGPEAARYLLALGFQPADMERMNDLAQLAQRGEIAEHERQELESYLHVSNLLAVMQSEARHVLKSGR